MAEWHEKIPDSMLSAGVSSLADRPNKPASYGVGGLSAEQLKKRFDTLSIALIEKLNAVIEGVQANDFADHVKLGLDKYTTLGAFRNAIADGSILDELSVELETGKRESVAALLRMFSDDIAALEEATKSSTTPEAGKLATYNDKGELNVSLRFEGGLYTGAAVPIDVADKLVRDAEEKFATSIRVDADASTNKLTVSLLNERGEVVASSADVELPLGQFVEAVLSDDGKDVIFTLANGSTVTIPTESIGGNIKLADSTGDSTEMAMSQKATTDALNAVVAYIDENVASSVPSEDIDSLKVQMAIEKSYSESVLYKHSTESFIAGRDFSVGYDAPASSSGIVIGKASDAKVFSNYPLNLANYSIDGMEHDGALSISYDESTNTFTVNGTVESSSASKTVLKIPLVNSISFKSGEKFYLFVKKVGGSCSRNKGDVGFGTGGDGTLAFSVKPPYSGESSDEAIVQDDTEIAFFGITVPNTGMTFTNYQFTVLFGREFEVTRTSPLTGVEVFYNDTETETFEPVFPLAIDRKYEDGTLSFYFLFDGWEDETGNVGVDFSVSTIEPKLTVEQEEGGSRTAVMSQYAVRNYVNTKTSSVVSEAKSFSQELFDDLRTDVANVKDALKGVHYETKKLTSIDSLTKALPPQTLPYIQVNSFGRYVLLLGDEDKYAYESDIGVLNRMPNLVCTYDEETNEFTFNGVANGNVYIPIVPVLYSDFMKIEALEEKTSTGACLIPTFTYDENESTVEQVTVAWHAGTVTKDSVTSEKNFAQITSSESGGRVRVWKEMLDEYEGFGQYIRMRFGENDVSVTVKDFKIKFAIVPFYSEEVNSVKIEFNKYVSVDEIVGARKLDYDKTIRIYVNDSDIYEEFGFAPEVDVDITYLEKI